MLDIVRPSGRIDSGLLLARRESVMEPAIAKLDSALSAAEPLILPPYKGSTPRGGFGATFRRVVRVKRATPHPFEIEPPNERKRVYRPDEAITFGLIPISRAIAYLPYFIYTFDEIGRTGIGKRLIPGEKDSYLLIYGRPLAVPVL